MNLEQKIYVQICALFTLYIHSCIENYAYIIMFLLCFIVLVSCFFSYFLT